MMKCEFRVSASLCIYINERWMRIYDGTMSLCLDNKLYYFILLLLLFCFKLRPEVVWKREGSCGEIDKS